MDKKRCRWHTNSIECFLDSMEIFWQNQPKHNYICTKKITTIASNTKRRIVWYPKDLRCITEANVLISSHSLVLIKHLQNKGISWVFLKDEQKWYEEFFFTPHSKLLVDPVTYKVKSVRHA